MCSQRSHALPSTSLLIVGETYWAVEEVASCGSLACLDTTPRILVRGPRTSSSSLPSCEHCSGGAPVDCMGPTSTIGPTTAHYTDDQYGRWQVCSRIMNHIKDTCILGLRSLLEEVPQILQQ